MLYCYRASSSESACSSGCASSRERWLLYSVVADRYRDRRCCICNSSSSSSAQVTRCSSTASTSTGCSSRWRSAECSDAPKRGDTATELLIVEGELSHSSGSLWMNALRNSSTAAAVQCVHLLDRVAAEATSPSVALCGISCSCSNSSSCCFDYICM
jgi:hypothetical protein